jgi:5'-nucleotidase
MLMRKNKEKINLRPTILVTNDDGINAPGIRTLIKVIRRLEDVDVVVVAPDRPRSGQGHAITVSSPLRVKKLKQDDHYVEYGCNGTPVDCIKLGRQVIMRREPDLVVSGINHGSNASINVLYSGTMAAVFEAAVDGIPAIGFSVNDFSHAASLTHTEKFVERITRSVLANGLPDGICLNVNIPAGNGKRVKGVKICRQSMGTWVEEFDERVDPRGRDYYWITGVFSNPDNKEDTDTWALEQNYVAVVPMKVDFTAYEVLQQMESYDFDPRKYHLKKNRSLSAKS